MSALAKAPATAPATWNLRTAQTLTTITVILTAIAAAGGLFWDGLYREPVWTLSQMKGQDMITLLTLPFLVWAQVAAGRGSVRAVFAWIGLMGYVFYTYTMASFGFFFNEFFLLYVALFALSAMALISLLTSIDAEELKRRFDAAHPRGPVVGYVAFIGIILFVMWIGQMFPFFLDGTIPDPIVKAETPTSAIYVLDLGLVFPVALIAANWLWRKLAWGYVMAGFLLFKAITMGLALLSMSLFAYFYGQLTEYGLTAVWAVLTASGAAMSLWFFRHCRD